MGLLWSSGLTQLWGLVRRAVQGPRLVSILEACRTGGQEGKMGIKWGEQGQARAHEDEACVGSRCLYPGGTSIFQKPGPFVMGLHRPAWPRMGKAGEDRGRWPSCCPGVPGQAGRSQVWYHGRPVPPHACCSPTPSPRISL